MSESHTMSAAAHEHRLDGRRVLVTGVTGYVGNQLVEPLLNAGAEARVLTRDADRVSDRTWKDRVTIMSGDATNNDDLRHALAGIDIAYYLLHSMDGRGDLRTRDRAMAEQFAHMSEEQGVDRIVYLGGLHPEGKLSEHLASRVEVGEVFLASSVDAIVLQAGVILGAGSASFQMLRYLTLRLPVMAAPRWLNNRIQPIAIADVLHYLLAAGATRHPNALNRTFDIGGLEVVTYSQLIQRYAQVAGIDDRIIITVPMLTPALSSHWIGAITPVSAGITRPLVGSLIHEVIVKDPDARTLLAPDISPTSLNAALAKAERDSPEHSAVGAALEIALALPTAVAASARTTAARLMKGFK